MKRYVSKFKEDYNLYHASNYDFVIGKTYKAISNKGTFGDFEKLIEYYRPKNCISRLNCFFTSPSLKYVHQFGNTLYTVTPIGKTTICSLGWISILIDFCFNKKYVDGYTKKGYSLSKIKKEDSEIIKKYVENYFLNVPIRKSDIIGLKNTEYGIKEILCTSIKIINKK